MEILEIWSFANALLVIFLSTCYRTLVDNMDICNTVESVTVVNGVTSTGKKRKRREAPFIVEEPIAEEVKEPIMATKVE